jgi:hypothetical protein
MLPGLKPTVFVFWLPWLPPGLLLGEGSGTWAWPLGPVVVAGGVVAVGVVAVLVAVAVGRVDVVSCPQSPHPKASTAISSMSCTPSTASAAVKRAAPSLLLTRSYIFVSFID